MGTEGHVGYFCCIKELLLPDSIESKVIKNLHIFLDE